MANATFCKANLTNASFSYSDLTNAILTDANLASVDFSCANLNGCVLVNANLMNADFSGTNMTNAVLTSANLMNTNLDNNIDFTDVTLNNANLMNARIDSACFTRANMAGSNLMNASIWFTDMTRATLANANLMNASLWDTDMTNATLVNANLRNCGICFSNFTDANLTNAKLNSAYFRSSVLNGADMRGATGFRSDDSTTQNTIMSDGTIQGLILDKDNPRLIVRNFECLDHQSPIAIHVAQQMQLSNESIIEIIMNDKHWNSTISFSNGIPVALDGTLLLEIDAANVEALAGTSFHIFDWSGVNPTGQFQISSDETWDTSRLYTDGTVIFLHAPEPLTLVQLASIAIIAGLGVAVRRREDLCAQGKLQAPSGNGVNEAMRKKKPLGKLKAYV